MPLWVFERDTLYFMLRDARAVRDGCSKDATAEVSALIVAILQELTARGAK